MKRTQYKGEKEYVEKLVKLLDRKIKQESNLNGRSKTDLESEPPCGHCAEPLTERVDNLLSWYINKASHARTSYYGCSMLVTGIPLVIAVVNSAMGCRNDSPCWFPVIVTFLSGLTSIISGWLVLSRSQENWVRYRNAAEALKDEVNLYLNDAGDYRAAERRKDEGRTSYILAGRIEDIVSGERAMWTGMRKSSSDDKMKG